MKRETGSIAVYRTVCQNLATIDFKTRKGTAYGVYELDGDTLTLCVTRSGGPRPNEFATKHNDDRILTRYKKKSVASVPTGTSHLATIVVDEPNSAS